MAKDYTALDVGRVVNVTINLQPKAAGRRNFGVLMLLTDSDAIDHDERMRNYTGLDDVAGDFGLASPVYYAASLYYGQTPRPRDLMVGRWVAEPVGGIIKGSVLSAAEKDLALWTAVADGGFDVQIDGSTVSITDLDFSTATNLDGVASIINTALAGAGTIVYDGSRFTLTSPTTGTSSTVNYLTPPVSGTDVGAMMKLADGLALPPIAGADAESPVEAVQRLAEMSSQWYGLHIAASAEITSDEHIDIAGFVEGSSQSRIYGVTSSDALMLEATIDTDIASELKKLGYLRSFVQFSSHNPYAAVSMLGRAFTVNFNANRSTITLKFKQEPGVVYEQLTETQAQALAAKNANVFVYYNTDQAIIQEGTMANGAFFDEVHGTDWLQNALQIGLWNALYQRKTKIPQTNSGTAILVAVAKRIMDEAVNNGLVAPGVWNADGFGELETGDYLDLGYYVYMPDINTQDQSEREQRKSTAMQTAAKLAGAIHFVTNIVDVNR